ncbi:MAG: hypothetical protein QXO40_04095 [Candidatus Aenigmatarchaeota archaeon]
MVEDFEQKLNEVFNEQSEKGVEFQIIDNEIISLFYRFIFDKLSKLYNDERIKLTEEEDNLLTKATSKWLNYRLPKFLLNHPIDFEFGLALLSVLGSKLMIIVNARKKQLDNFDFRTERERENNISEENNK